MLALTANNDRPKEGLSTMRKFFTALTFLATALLATEAAAQQYGQPYGQYQHPPQQQWSGGGGGGYRYQEQRQSYSYGGVQTNCFVDQGNGRLMQIQCPPMGYAGPPRGGQYQQQPSGQIVPFVAGVIVGAVIEHNRDDRRSQYRQQPPRQRGGCFQDRRGYTVCP